MGIQHVTYRKVLHINKLSKKEEIYIIRKREKGLVSIIVTNFNRAEFLEECLESLLKQSYKNIEIIVVDDASTDTSSDLFCNFKKKVVDSNPEMRDRIMGVSLPRNVGYEGPLTIGMFLSRGEFIAIQDSDDLSHPERIEKEVNYLIENKLDLVGSLYAGFTNKIGDEFLNLEKPAKWIRFGTKEIKQIYEENGHCICHGTILFKGRVFDQLGGYTRKYRKEADFEFIRKCVLYGFNTDNIPEVLYYYRRHDQQMSKK